MYLCDDNREGALFGIGKGGWLGCSALRWFFEYNPNGRQIYAQYVAPKADVGRPARRCMVRIWIYIYCLCAF